MAARSQLLQASRRAAEVLHETRARARIDEGYTRVNPILIADFAGIVVMFRHMDRLLGAFLKAAKPGIILNTARPVGLVHMTCAHELGHFFLNHDATADLEIEYGLQGSAMEQEADQFAFSLLAPSWLIVHIARLKNWQTTQLRNPEIVYQLSLRLGTSYSSTVWSLYRHNVISLPLARKMIRIPPRVFKQSLVGAENLSNPLADVWLLDEVDRQLILEPHDSDLFVLDLPSRVTAGFTWVVDEAMSKGFNLDPVLLDADEIPPREHFGTEPTVGSAATVRCILSGRGLDEEPMLEARTTVSLVEKQLWMGNGATDASYAFNTEYEALALGLSRVGKNALIDEATPQHD